MKFEREASGPENEQRFRPWEERNESGDAVESIRERRLSEEQEELSKNLDEFRRG